MRWIILVSLCLVLAALADGKREKNDDGSTSYRDLLKRLIEVAGKQSHTGKKSRVHNLGDLSFRYIANVSPPQSEDPKDYLVQRVLELAAEHHGRGSLQISYRQSPGSAKKSRVHNLGDLSFKYIVPLANPITEVPTSTTSTTVYTPETTECYDDTTITYDSTTTSPVRKKRKTPRHNPYYVDKPFFS